ncbi:MAG TPA: carboxypeptidase regulatory-like domain-containing protein [Firmicutes bacterium]|nr:carboxypeptidase regulatory-like domain-containing protein [Bacillota bacterium]
MAKERTSTGTSAGRIEQFYMMPPGSGMIWRRVSLMVLPTILVLTSLISLTGCFGDCSMGGQASNPPAPMDTGYIAGYVTEGRGGPPAPGGTVTAVPAQEGGAARIRAAGLTRSTGRGYPAAAAAIATVGQDGRYSLALRPGKYDVIVVKEGMGTTKAQGVVVRAGESVTVNLPQYAPPGSAMPPVTPASPTLAVEGVAHDQVVSGSVEVLVKVVEENLSLPVESIEIRVGHESPNPNYAGVPSPSSRALTWAWQTTDYGNGSTYIHVSAYDAGRNLTILKIPLTVANGVPATPSGLRVIASTCGENISRGTVRGRLYKARRGILSGNLCTTSGGGLDGVVSGIVPKAAPPGGFLAVQVVFDSQPDAKGYRVYRSTTGGDPWVLAGEIQSQAGYPGSGILEFWDTDPALSAGRKAFYRVAAYNDAGEGAPTDPVYTIPLPKFNVSLVAPADGASDLSLTPVLAWEAVWEPYGPGEPGYNSMIAPFAQSQTQVYQVEVKRSADGFPVWTATLTTSGTSISPAQAASTGAPTQVVYNSDGAGRALEPDTSYEWDVSAYLQVRYSANSEAFAWSAGDGLSVNGPFGFFTGAGL